MNLRKFHVGAIMGAIALLLVACSSLQPIQNFNDQYVPSNLTMNQVRQSIQMSVNASHWKSRSVRPGLIEATLKSHGKASVVNINYNTKAYSITYKNSSGLQQQDGRIHKNYNRWVSGLNERIQIGFQKLQQHH